MKRRRIMRGTRCLYVCVYIHICICYVFFLMFTHRHQTPCPPLLIYYLREFKFLDSRFIITKRHQNQGPWGVAYIYIYIHIICVCIYVQVLWGSVRPCLFSIWTNRGGLEYDESSGPMLFANLLHLRLGVPKQWLFGVDSFFGRV